MNKHWWIQATEYAPRPNKAWTTGTRTTQTRPRRSCARRRVTAWSATLPRAGVQPTTRPCPSSAQHTPALPRSFVWWGVTGKKRLRLPLSKAKGECRRFQSVASSTDKPQRCKHRRGHRARPHPSLTLPYLLSSAPACPILRPRPELHVLGHPYCRGTWSTGPVPGHLLSTEENEGGGVVSSAQTRGKNQTAERGKPPSFGWCLSGRVLAAGPVPAPVDWPKHMGSLFIQTLFLPNTNITLNKIILFNRDDQTG